MTYNFTPVREKIKELEERLRADQQSVRTGRASPALLEGVVVNVLNSRLPLKQLASVAVEGVRFLKISPWDKNQIKAIAAAVTSANLGVSLVADALGLRVIFPELTTESRQRFVKIVREQLETTRVMLRQVRDKVWSEIQKLERDGEISEDEKFRSKDMLQKLIDQSNQNIEALTDKKEKEILN